MDRDSLKKMRYSIFKEAIRLNIGSVSEEGGSDFS